MDKEKCNEWAEAKKSPTPINPLTKRKLKKNGPKYMELDKDCQQFITDINPICVKWLKDNHNDLYVQLMAKSKKPPKKSEKSPKKSPSPPQSKFYTINQRKQFNDLIKAYFSKIIIANGKACMSKSKTLLSFVENSKLVGYGSFGNVYSVTLPKPNSEISVAIKEGKISKIQFRKAMKKQYPLEYLFNKLINDLIDEKACPNFSYTYAIFFCDQCVVKQNFSEPISCSETVVEYFDYTLVKLKDFRDEVILSILFQILFALTSIQTRYGMFHNDIKKENILIKVIPSGGYWEYSLNEVTYNVPNYGYIAALNDFGVSLAFKPGINDEDDFAQRQVEVIKENNSYSLKIVSTELDSSVELNDMARFPVYYFHFDIIDTIFTFIGGSRTSQPGKHKAMNLSDNIFNLLQGFFVMRFREIVSRNRIDLLLAEHTIKKLFSNYLKSNNGVKIESYSL